HLALLFARLAPQVGKTEEALTLISRMISEMTGAPPRQLSALGLAASALLDKLGRYDEAFGYARRANALRGARYDAARVERQVDGLIASFTRRRLRSLPRSTRDSRKPL